MLKSNKGGAMFSFRHGLLEAQYYTHHHYSHSYFLENPAPKVKSSNTCMWAGQGNQVANGSGKNCFWFPINDQCSCMMNQLDFSRSIATVALDLNAYHFPS